LRDVVGHPPEDEDDSALDCDDDQAASTYAAPEMLTPSEENWLRQHLKETADTMRKMYRKD
jgi:hypothetical protein